MPMYLLCTFKKIFVNPGVDDLLSLFQVYVFITHEDFDRKKNLSLSNKDDDKNV